MKTMAKIIGRTLILLLAALAVVGVLLAISKSNPQAQSAAPRDGLGQPGFQANSGQAGELTDQRCEFRRHFEGEGHRGPGGGPGEGRSGFIVFALLKNLGVIAVIVLLYQGISRLGGRLARRKVLK